MDGRGTSLNGGDMGSHDPAVTVRTLLLSDCQRLVRIDAAITGRTRTMWFEGKLKRALADADVCISLGAERDGILVGAIMANVHYGEFGIAEAVAVLDTVLVDRSFAGQGIASAMLDQLLLNLGALRVSKLRTEVGWNELELVDFFNRKGFTPAPRLVLEREVASER